MKTSRMAILLAAAALLLPATATSAFAAENGTVYGRATMTHVMSIVISADGTEADLPLIYRGAAGEKNVHPDRDNTFMVTNNGASPVSLYLAFGSNPTDASDPASYYDLGSTCGENRAVWTVHAGGADSSYDVPAENTAPVQMTRSFEVDGSSWFTSLFSFPSNYTGGTFNMSLLITASAAQ